MSNLPYKYDFRNRSKNSYAQYRECPQCHKQGLHDYPVKIRNHGEVKIDRYITSCRYCHYEEK